MHESCTGYVGLDVHKESIDIAVADAPREAEVRHLGAVAGGVGAVTKAMRKLVSAGHRLHIVYEAGPCGFVLQRHFTALGGAPRRTLVLRYPTLAYQHDQPSHILIGWHPQAPSRSPCGYGLLNTSVFAEELMLPFDK